MDRANENFWQSTAPAAKASSSDDWHTAPPLTAEALDGTFWQLTNLDGKTLSPFLVLAPQGLVGNFKNASADMWLVVNGALYLVDENGLPSVVFSVARTENGKLTALAGRGTIDGEQAFYALTATVHPAHPLFATPATVQRKATFLASPEKGPMRPNLVIVPAGSTSLHPRWFDEVSSTTRNWDLCIGYYGNETPVIPSPYEYLAHIPATKKFRIIYDLLYPGSPLWGYESIWLPDDDLLCSGRDINRMFHVFQKHGLDLAQPSLRQDETSHPNHPITVQRPGSLLRYEGFVEIMCPIFSTRTLRICIESMRDVDSGYGLDHLWPSFIGKPHGRMAIIDAVAISHTRPIGATYNIRAAINEQATLFQAYGYKYAPIEGVR